MNTKSSIFTSGDATRENTLLAFISKIKIEAKIENILAFISEIKIDLTLKNSNILFLVCFKIAIIYFIPVRQHSGQRRNIVSRRSATILCFHRVYWP